MGNVAKLQIRVLIFWKCFYFAEIQCETLTRYKWFPIHFLVDERIPCQQCADLHSKNEVFRLSRRLSRLSHIYATLRLAPESDNDLLTARMGIKGLTALLSQNAPNSIKEHDIKTLFGRKVAIDASMSIYQFLIAVRQKDGEMLTNDAGETTSHLMGLFYRTLRIVENGIKPVYVFDGKPPELKKGVVSTLQETFIERVLTKTIAIQAFCKERRSEGRGGRSEGSWNC